MHRDCACDLRYAAMQFLKEYVDAATRIAEVANDIGGTPSPHLVDALRHMRMIAFAAAVDAERVDDEPCCRDGMDCTGACPPDFVITSDTESV